MNLRLEWVQDADSDYKWHLKRGRFHVGYVSKSFDDIWTWVVYERLGRCLTKQEAQQAAMKAAEEASK